MATFSQEQNIACSKTHLSDTTQEQTITYSNNKKIKIQRLFILGSVYSTSTSGAEQTTETNN